MAGNQFFVSMLLRTGFNANVIMAVISILNICHIDMFVFLRKYPIPVKSAHYLPYRAQKKSGVGLAQKMARLLILWSGGK